MNKHSAEASLHDYGHVHPSVIYGARLESYEQGVTPQQRIRYLAKTELRFKFRMDKLLSRETNTSST